MSLTKIKAAQINLDGSGGLEPNGSNGTLKVKVEADKGLSVGANGLATVIESNKGLSVGVNGLATVVDANNGMAVGATGLKLNFSSITPITTVDNTTSYLFVATNASGVVTKVAFKDLYTDVATNFAGVGLSATSGVMAVDLNELADTPIDVANDSFAFIDASNGNNSKRESVADFVSAIAGSGLDASSGQLTVNATEFLTTNQYGEYTINGTAEVITTSNVNTSRQSADSAFVSNQFDTSDIIIFSKKFAKYTGSTVDVSADMLGYLAPGTASGAYSQVYLNGQLLKGYNSASSGYSMLAGAGEVDITGANDKLAFNQLVTNDRFDYMRVKDTYSNSYYVMFKATNIVSGDYIAITESS